MPAISDLFRQGWPHDSTCQCVPCLKTAFDQSYTKAIACGKRYLSLREEPSLADEATRARTEWTQARQETILADHALRAAQDRDFHASKALKDLQVNPWNPPEWEQP